jgi:hypothetical protein
MLLDDDCHSIDNPNMRCILENVKFPNLICRLRTKIPLLPQRDKSKGGLP